MRHWTAVGTDAECHPPLRSGHAGSVQRVVVGGTEQGLELAAADAYVAAFDDGVGQGVHQMAEDRESLVIGGDADDLDEVVDHFDAGCGAEDFGVEREFWAAGVLRHDRVERPPGQQPHGFDLALGVGEDVGNGLVLDDRDGAAACLGEREAVGDVEACRIAATANTLIEAPLGKNALRVSSTPWPCAPSRLPRGTRTSLSMTRVVRQPLSPGRS